MKHHPFLLFGGARAGSTTLRGFLKDIGINIGLEPINTNDLDAIFKKYDAVKWVTANREMEEWVKALEGCVDRGARVIHLERKNTLEQAVSMALKRATDKAIGYYYNRERFKQFCASYTLPIEDVVWWKELCEKRADETAKALQGKPHIAVWYEELYEEYWEPVVREILSFIGVEWDERFRGLGDERFGHSRRGGPDVYALIPNIREIEIKFASRLT